MFFGGWSYLYYIISMTTPRQEYQKQYYQKNKEKLKERSKKQWKQYYESNKNTILKYQNEYQIENKEKIKEYFQDYCKNNLEKRQIINKKYYENNKENINKYISDWKENNINKQKEYFQDYYQNNKQFINQRQKEYNQTIPHIVRWRNILKGTLERLGKDKENKTHKLLGYSSNELKEYLDKQNMDWNNDEIDHKIPLSWFNDNAPINVINDLRNLQSLNKEQNRKKNNIYADSVNKEYYDLVIEYIKEEYKNKITKQ